MSISAPYAIQRMSFKNNSVENASFDDVLSMDYMGSAEFEYGALPKSLKALTKKADALVVSVDSNVTNYEDCPLFIIGNNNEDVSNYLAFIPSLIDDTIALKESSYFKYQFSDSSVEKKMLNGKKTGAKNKKGPAPDHNHYYRRVNAWWDIENNIIFCFGEKQASLIVSAIKGTRDKKKVEAESSDAKISNNAKSWF